MVKHYLPLGTARIYYNSLHFSSTNRMALASGRAKKENLNKFQNKPMNNLFIEGLLDLTFYFLPLTSGDFAFQTFLGRVVFCTKINPPNLKQQGMNYFSITSMQNQ